MSSTKEWKEPLCGLYLARYPREILDVIILVIFLWEVLPPAISNGHISLAAIWGISHLFAPRKFLFILLIYLIPGSSCSHLLLQKMCTPITGPNRFCVPSPFLGFFCAPFLRPIVYLKYPISSKCTMILL